MLAFFVKYNALDHDPLDFGVQYFADYKSAFEFAEEMTNRGLATTIYCGTMMLMKYQSIKKQP